MYVQLTCPKNLSQVGHLTNRYVYDLAGMHIKKNKAKKSTSANLTFHLILLIRSNAEMLIYDSNITIPFLSTYLLYLANHGRHRIISCIDKYSNNILGLLSYAFQLHQQSLFFFWWHCSQPYNRVWYEKSTRKSL